MTSILHVTQPVDGGVGRVVYGLATWQHRNGYSVTVACPDGWLAAELAAEGVRREPWPARRAPGPGLTRELRRLSDIIEQVAPDVVHLHSSKAGLVGRLAIRGQRRTVFQPHAWSWQAGLVRGVARRWERVAARWTDLIICVSTDEAAAGRTVGVRAALCVVPNGVDLEAFGYADEATRDRARGALDIGGPLVVCVGRLVPRKGQEDLLRAWPQIRQSAPTATLALVGGGPDLTRLTKLSDRLGVRSSVRFAGQQLDVAHWYAAADVVAMPSRFGEGMALTTLEAMACGRSVVAADAEGVRESLPPAAGSIVPAGDVPALAAALAERLTDPALAWREGQVGRHYVEARHDARRAYELMTERSLALAEPARR